MKWITNNEHICSLLESVWDNLPTDAQATIAILTGGEMRITWDDVTVGDIGVAETSGGEYIAFHSRRMSLMPDWCAACIVAHELAHVLLDVTGKRAQILSGGCNQILETEADELASWWGYDMGCCEAWIEHNAELLEKG